MPWCSEDSIGMIFYRLIISDIIVLNLVDILSASFFRLIRAPTAYDSAGVRPQKHLTLSISSLHAQISK